MNDPAKGNEVGNYRSIACLNIPWKVLSGIFAENTDTSKLTIYYHLSKKDAEIHQLDLKCKW